MGVAAGLRYTLSLGCREVISECTVTGDACVRVCVVKSMLCGQKRKKKNHLREILFFFYSVVEDMQFVCVLTSQISCRRGSWWSRRRLAQSECRLTFLC